MKFGSILTLGLLLGLPVPRQAGAVTADAGSNPFKVIVDRNPFGLKPPPPPPAPLETNPPPAKFKLLGTANVFGTKKVILQSADPPKPGQQPGQGQDLPFTLAEGEGEHGVEVVAIDELGGSVKINNHGVAMTLTLEKDGVKLAAGPALGVPPPVAGMMPGGPMPMPGIQPLPRPGFGLPAPFMGSPPAAPKGAMLGTPGTPAGNMAAADPAALGNTFNALPARPVRTDSSQVDPVQQMVLMEANRSATQDLVNQGQMPPLPPTDATVLLNPTTQPTAPSPLPRGFPLPHP